VTQKREAEFGVAPAAVETVLGDVGDLVNGVRAQIRKFT
jgi:hypothetical protein